MVQPVVNVKEVISVAQAAGVAAMAVYEKDFSVYVKADKSPLTEADMAAHRSIVDGLKAITPHIPILSEESSTMEVAERDQWSCYWLVDPLDGTKEFVKKNGEFTVNIALINGHVPVLGVVYAPALDLLYWGEIGCGAFKLSSTGHVESITVSDPPADTEVWRIVGSRSHQSEAFKTFVQRLSSTEIVSMGSSLKLCLVAEGKADLYPRLGPTSEWDTAAAHAIVEAAGGQVLEYSSLQRLSYNQRPDSLLNPHFIVCSRPHAAWAASDQPIVKA